MRTIKPERPNRSKIASNYSGLKKVEVFGLEKKSQVGWGEVNREIGSNR
jgi:hypothetical protein